MDFDALHKLQPTSREELDQINARILALADPRQSPDRSTGAPDLLAVLADMQRRLDALEQQLSEQGVNALAVAIERRIVSRMRYGRNPQIERAK